MEVLYSKQFIKSFRALDRNLQIRIRRSLGRLPHGNVKKLQSRVDPALYRIRVGKYRVLFSMTEKGAYIIDVDSRGDVYKKY